MQLLFLTGMFSILRRCVVLFQESEVGASVALAAVPAPGQHSEGHRVQSPHLWEVVTVNILHPERRAEAQDIPSLAQGDSGAAHRLHHSMANRHCPPGSPCSAPSSLHPRHLLLPVYILQNILERFCWRPLRFIVGLVPCYLRPVEVSRLLALARLPNSGSSLGRALVALSPRQTCMFPTEACVTAPGCSALPVGLGRAACVAGLGG